MKIASWNVNSLNVRLPQLLDWLGEFQPDVVGLQETKLEDHRFPEDVDPTQPDFNPLAEVLRWYKINQGQDNMDYADSPDKKNFEAWRAQATGN